MTGKEMLGNIKTENLVEFARSHGLTLSLDFSALNEAFKLVTLTFMEQISFP